MTDRLLRHIKKVLRQYLDADPESMRRVAQQGIKDRSLHREECGREFVNEEEYQTILNYQRTLKKTQSE